jgi:hypothetical protein
MAVDCGIARVGERREISWHEMRAMGAPRYEKDEEGFLSAQADTFAGANVKEKASACSVRNDGGRAWLIASGNTVPVGFSLLMTTAPFA